MDRFRDLRIELRALPAGDGQSWIHLVPSGTFQPRDGRGPFRVDDPAAVVAASRAYAGKRQIPVDYEHQTVFAPKNGQPAPAAGWIDALQVRDDGIWGRVRWTDRAASYIAAREYRYLSPVLIIPAGDNRVERIESVALTNIPAIDKLAALNRAGPSQGDTMDQLLQQIRELLGLPADATEDDIVAALRDLLTSRNSSEPDPARFVPIGDFEQAVSEVNKLSRGVSRRLAEDHVERQVRNGNMPPALRSWAISLCTINKPAFDAFVERTRGAFNRIIDPKAAGIPVIANPDRLSEQEQQVCARMGITAEELIAARSFIKAGEGE